jgi:hypothetical protein
VLSTHRSTDLEVRSLIDSLGVASRRESAVARLTIIGARAVSRLIAAFESASDRHVQIAILRVLETTGDDRALPIARHALSCGGDLGVEAVAVMEALLGRGALPVQAEALDALVEVVGRADAERRVRLAAAAVVQGIARTIGPDAQKTFESELTASEAVWADAADGHLPDDPATLRAAAIEQAGDAPLPIVHRIMEVVRAREQMLEAAGAGQTASAQWQAVRGALHQGLALRGSRIALYDLRESVAASRAPMPPSFIAAMQTVGDQSCLEPLAAAFASASSAVWRHQLAIAFHAIVKRERLTKRHSAMRRALARAPELG